MKLLIINGPNLNLLGTREKDIYGHIPFTDYLATLAKKFPAIRLDYFQSNIEGEIIDKLHASDGNYDGVILNAGGYTHTSVAIADAVKAISTPVVEVHISNIFDREEYRHVSLIGPNVKGSVIGFGLDSYRLALLSFS
jgi:3-dehydroquinate dehydratase-2